MRIRIVVVTAVAGFAFLASTASAQTRGCPDATETWMGLRVCEEPATRTGYDRDDFGSGYRSLEDDIIRGLPQQGGKVFTPYTCTLFDITTVPHLSAPQQHLRVWGARWRGRREQLHQWTAVEQVELKNP